MRRRRLRIRRWLALAAALVTLILASSASALPQADGGGGSTAYPQTPTVTNEPGGFSWSDAAIGAGVTLGAALGGAGILRVASNRRRVALTQ